CLAVASALLLAAYRDVDRERVATAEQRDRADSRFRLARRAVDEFHTQVGNSSELKAHGLEPLREKLLRGAASFYLELVRERANDPELLTEHGRAYLRLADLATQLNDTSRAEAVYAQARDVFDHLAADRPVDLGLRY